MPALSAELSEVYDMEAIPSNATVMDGGGLKVICAWPVSGQYGPGSRILYYVLVATCVLARKSDWLRNACLAAAMLLPMVAAIHGVVLAAVNVNHAVDLDIFGAFQLCAIGVLVAPVTAKLSKTYFKGPGHNIIILWSLFVVAGLISLAVEFYRVANSTFDCKADNNGAPLNLSSPFPYGQPLCNIECSTASGPTSMIRGGAGNDIYIVPVPTILTFNVSILLAAACCIPAILLVASLLLQSFKTNWNTRFVDQLALKLRAFVFVVEVSAEAPTVEWLREHVGTLNKLGIIRTRAGVNRMLADPHPRDDKTLPSTAHIELDADMPSPRQIIQDTTDRDRFGTMFDRLRSRSSLIKIDYEIGGSPLQIIEFNLEQADPENDIAIDLYTMLQNLDQEGVDAIVVEGIPDGISKDIEQMMCQLRSDERVRGEGLATTERLSKSGDLFARYAMASVFSVLVIAVLVIGEMNFWSAPIRWQTEPMANIGQWAPIAGTFLLVAGSIYVVVADKMRRERRRLQRRHHTTEEQFDGYIELVIRQALGLLIKLSDMLSPQRKRFDDSAWAQNAQRQYPTVPGEENKVRGLSETKQYYKRRRNSASSYRSVNTSSNGSRAASRERHASEISNSPTTRRRTLNLEPPEVAHTKRRATSSSQTDPIVVSPTSTRRSIPLSEDVITLVVTKPDNEDV